MSTATIHVTKLSAAERQLRTAIRLYFAGEDELAVHTIGSAAYRLLADIKAERGMNEAADVYLQSVFYVVRDFRNGSLPTSMRSDPKFMAWVRSLANKLPIESNSKIEDIRISLSREDVATFWSYRNKVANFLKHADRDSDSSISLDQVDNFFLLMLCYRAYTDLVHDHPGNEGLVFWLFWGAHLADGEFVLPQDVQHCELIERLRALPESQRHSLCSALITKLNQA